MELQWRSVWVSLVVFVAACLLNRLDISIRHFSVALALIVLLLAPLRACWGCCETRCRQSARRELAGNCARAGLHRHGNTRLPNYFPYLNMLSMGRPGYTLVNDSNLDWNQALPEVESFVRQRRLKQVLLDELWIFGASRLRSPGAALGLPATCTARRGAMGCSLRQLYAGFWKLYLALAVSAPGSRRWQYVRVQLPEVIPAAGQPGGPPLPADYRYVGGMQNTKGFPYS